MIKQLQVNIETINLFGRASVAPAPSYRPPTVRQGATVHRSRFSLSSFPLSQRPPEPEKLVFRAPRLRLKPEPPEPCQTG